MRTRTVLSAAVFAITTAFLAAPSAMAGFTEIKIDTRGALTSSQQPTSTQVAEKPKGVPETGGGQEEEPIADVVEEEDPIQRDAAPAQSSGSNAGVVALVGVGVLAAGGAGFLLFRLFRLFRRSRRRT